MFHTILEEFLVGAWLLAIGFVGGYVYANWSTVIADVKTVEATTTAIV